MFDPAWLHQKKTVRSDHTGNELFRWEWTPLFITASSVPKWLCPQATSKRSVQLNTTTIGLDIAKTVFQVHGVDHVGRRASSGGYAELS